MSQAPVMPVFTDALLGDTLHLSTEEFGAYCLLLLATWRNNGRALPDNDTMLRRICRASPTRWRNLRPVLIPFFSIGDGYWHQKRLENEWVRVQKKITKNRENGALGGRSKALNSRGNGALNGSASLERSPKRKASNPDRGTVGAPLNHVDYSQKEIGDDPSGSLRSPAPSAPLAEVKKAQLVQKLMRYAHATMNERQRQSAIAGLTGLDAEHSAQWWLDNLDQKMRAQRWEG